MRLSARADYAVRAAVELASRGTLVRAEELADAQAIPHSFLTNILVSLRRSGIVRSRRGAEGGYELGRPAGEVTIADVIRAIEGPLADVRGVRPDELEFVGAAEPLRDVWIALRASIRGVLEHVTLADVASGELPEEVRRLTADAEAWRAH